MALFPRVLKQQGGEKSPQPQLEPVVFTEKCIKVGSERSSDKFCCKAVRPGISRLTFKDQTCFPSPVLALEVF